MSSQFDEKVLELTGLSQYAVGELKFRVTLKHVTPRSSGGFPLTP